MTLSLKIQIFQAKIENRENIIKAKTIKLVLKHIFFILLIEKFNDKSFKLIFNSSFIRSTKLREYSYPEFILESNLRSLNLKSSVALNKDSQKTEDITPSKYKNSFESQRIEKYTLTNAVILVPPGWVNSKTENGAIHGPLINFFATGLLENGFVVEIIEINGNNCQSLITNKYIEKSNFIFIWSLTQIQLIDEALENLVRLNLSSSPVTKIIGIITSPITDQKSVNLYKDWAKVTRDVIYFEEEFEYKFSLKKLFNVHHMPYIQLTKRSFAPVSVFTPSVHISCRIKQNRLAWVLVARYHFIIHEVKYFIKIFSDPLRRLGLQNSYVDPEFFQETQEAFGFGFVMAHRSSVSDSHLLASFWNYYRLGIIPIVQMQKSTQIASYFEPYKDYIPVVNDFDLFNIIKIATENPQHFNKLKSEILVRMENEFTPKNIVYRALKYWLT